MHTAASYSMKWFSLKLRAHRRFPLVRNTAFASDLGKYGKRGSKLCNKFLCETWKRVLDLADLSELESRELPATKAGDRKPAKPVVYVI